MKVSVPNGTCTECPWILDRQLLDGAYLVNRSVINLVLSASLLLGSHPTCVWNNRLEDGDNVDLHFCEKTFENIPVLEGGVNKCVHQVKVSAPSTKYS